MYRARFGVALGVTVALHACAHEPGASGGALLPPPAGGADGAGPTTSASATSTARSTPIGPASSTIAARATVSPPPSAPPSDPPGVCTSSSLPPSDMIKDNVAATAMTGLAEIVTASTTALDGGTPAPTSGYVNRRFEVRVLRWFSGSGPERLVLHQGAEAPATVGAAGRLLLFSACPSADGSASAYEPDVGFFFPLDAACRAEAEALGVTAAKRANVGAKHRARACERPR